MDILVSYKRVTELKRVFMYKNGGVITLPDVAKATFNTKLAN